MGKVHFYHNRTLLARLSVPDFVSQPIFLQSCETKSRMESPGSRLEHCLISARKIVKWTVYLSVYVALGASLIAGLKYGMERWNGKMEWKMETVNMHIKLQLTRVTAANSCNTYYNSFGVENYPSATVISLNLKSDF